MKKLDYESAKRLWEMFFKKEFDEAHGVALVQDLFEKHKPISSIPLG